MTAVVQGVPGLGSFRLIKLSGGLWGSKVWAREAGWRPDGNYLWTTGTGYKRPDRLLLFHTTTAEAARSILAGGPERRIPLRGFDGWAGEAAFWCSSVPIVQDGLEVWNPRLAPTDGSVVEVVTLGVMVRTVTALEDRLRVDSTWPCLQFALDPDDVIAMRVVPDPRDWRSPEAVSRLVELERTRCLN